MPFRNETFYDEIFCDNFFLLLFISQVKNNREKKKH